MNAKKTINGIKYFLLLMGLVLLNVMPVLTQSEGPPQANMEMTKKNEKVDKDTGLPGELRLTDEQVAGVKKILKMVQSQAQQDREIFKGNGPGLIGAARRRLEMTDYHVENLLNQEQKKVYAFYKQNRKRDEELFLLTQGLMLTEEQQVKVRIILDEFHEKERAQRDKMHKNMDMPGGGMEGGGRGGSMAGGVHGGPPGGGGMGRGGMRGPGSAMMDAAEKYESKKAKKINKILTKDQQKMYKSIRKMLKKERQDRMPEPPKKMHR